MKLRATLEAALTRPVSAASLAVFRAVFGVTMLGEVLQSFRLGRIEAYYDEPTLLFPYYGFGWLGRLGEPWMTWLFVALAVLSAAVAVGAFYRVVCPLLFLGYTYTFVLDQTNYQNHLYLFCLVPLILSCTDAHRAFSVDARRQRLSPFVPAWQVALVAFQLGVVYAFGGLNKLDAEWLSGAPMDINLDEVRHLAVLEPYLSRPWVTHCFAWAGLLIDLLAVPGLLYRRSRPLTFAALSCFHFMNAAIFSIGSFPWFMLGATTIFLPPAFPYRLLRKFGVAEPPVPVVPVPPVAEASAVMQAPMFRLGRAQGVLLLGYAAIQLLLPLRSHLYPGNTAWTGDGEYFSWTMKLHLRLGRARLFVAPPSGEFVEAPLYAFLTGKQIRHLAYTPDMILRVSQHVKKVLPAGYRFKWDNQLSLNGREPQQYTIEDGAEIAKHRVSLAPTRIVLPLRQEHPPTPGELSALRERWRRSHAKSG